MAIKAEKKEKDICQCTEDAPNCDFVCVCAVTPLNWSVFWVEPKMLDKVTNHEHHPKNNMVMAV